MKARHAGARRPDDRQQARQVYSRNSRKAL